MLVLAGKLYFLCYGSYEPCHEKTGFSPVRKQRRRSAQLISTFIFASQTVQFPYFLNPKFPASNGLLCLCSSVSVGPGQKPLSPVFSHHGSYNAMTLPPLLGAAESGLLSWLLALPSLCGELDLLRGISQ